MNLQGPAQMMFFDIAAASKLLSQWYLTKGLSTQQCSRLPAAVVLSDTFHPFWNGSLAVHAGLGTHTWWG